MSTLHRAEDVGDELRRRIQTLTQVQGAETDIGTTVFRGRRKIDDEMIPCASIIEGDDTPARKHLRNQYEIVQRYIVFAYLQCDADDPNLAAHAALRDMKKAIFKEGDARWGGLVRDVEYIGRDIGPRADGSASVVAAIEILVTYVEELNAA